MISDVYPIIDVPDDAAQLTEQLGTKPKFWFERAASDWLFKQVRPHTGEDWSEKVACELCSLLGLPHAHYELASWRGRNGVATPSFVPNGGRLSHGNELMGHRVESYPTGETFRAREHTLERVLRIIGMDVVEPPRGFAGESNLASGADIFVGYLMLDAWISNQDRHHENWGLLWLPDGSVCLAPTYDHASSLGRNESDSSRRARLETRDRGYGVEAYVRRARSAFYLSPGESRPLSTLEAFERAAERYPGAARAWLERLSRVETASVTGILQSIPVDRMSVTAGEFARSMLDANRARLLGSRQEIP